MSDLLGLLRVASAILDSSALKRLKRSSNRSDNSWPALGEKVGIRASE